MRVSRRALLLAAASGVPSARAAQPSVLVCPLPAAPGGLIPGVSNAFVTRFLGGKIYRGLMRYGPGGALEPDLASAAGVSADGLTYLFRLRPGVTWHDSGGFGAEDVVFSLARFHAALQPGLRLDRVRVEAVDAQTVVLHLAAPGDLSMRLLDALSLPIVPRHVHDQPGWALDPRQVTPVGTGPFRVAEWLRLVRFEWFAGPKAALAGIDCPVLPDPAARLALAGGDAPVLLAGDAVPLSEVARLRAVPSLAVEADFPPAARSIAGLRLNLAAKPLDQQVVRLALACAIDRNTVLQDAWAGIGRVATGPLIAGCAGRNDAAVLPEYSPRAASAHLTAAGLRPGDDGIRTQLAYLHPPDPALRALFAVVRVALRQVGLEVTAEAVSTGEWRRRCAAGDYQMAGFLEDQSGDPALDLEPYAAGSPDLVPLLAGGADGLAAAQAALAASLPVIWLVEPGCPVARDRRLSLPEGVFGDFSGATLG